MEEGTRVGSFFFCGCGGAEVALPGNVFRDGGCCPGMPATGLRNPRASRSRRPTLVDEAFLRAEPPSAVCDADFDFEGCRVADVVAGRQRMGYDIDVEQKVVARPGFETCAAAAGIPGGLFPQVRADVGDMCLGRCEAGAVARRVEAAAHQRDVVAPPAFVAARNLDCESLFCCHTVQI